MAKRKRELEAHPSTKPANGITTTKVIKIDNHSDVKSNDLAIQIVVGSYERVLHGITASIAHTSSKSTVQFANSFLFNAHASSIRCLAISPLSAQADSDEQNVYLATGGSDEKINVFSLSARPMLENDKVPLMPSIGGSKVSENPGNRELGTLVQHSSNITALHFPTRSKLLSGSEDNTISISKTRDLTVVSTIKAPRPKAVGQPSGDTAPVGATPAGVNDFAVHPSMKLMVSVGRGERCMRLWNLVTGKKAGVLNFDRKVLASINESKYSSGEGRKIQWNSKGTEFAVAFERGAIVFEDAKPRCIVVPRPSTKVYQMSYLSTDARDTILALSTEDGRILFYDTTSVNEEEKESRSATCIAQLGGRAIGVPGRIKDFKMLQAPTEINEGGLLMVVTACSDGSIRVWQFQASDIDQEASNKANQIGEMIGMYETGSRITCLDAFVMLPPLDIAANMSESEAYSQSEGETGDDSEDEA